MISSASVGAALRPVQNSDLVTILTWRNDERIRLHMFNSNIIKPEQHYSWFDRVRDNPDVELLMLEVGGVAQGFMNLKIEPRSRIATWGFYVSPLAPQGAGSLLGRLTLRHCFLKRSVHKIVGEVLEHNTRSIKFHLRNRFLEEGRLRLHHFDGERYHDVLTFGLLSTEWNDE